MFNFRGSVLSSPRFNFRTGLLPESIFLRLESSIPYTRSRCLSYPILSLPLSLQTLSPLHCLPIAVGIISVTRVSLCLWVLSPLHWMSADALPKYYLPYHCLPIAVGIISVTLDVYHKIISVTRVCLCLWTLSPLHWMPTTADKCPACDSLVPFPVRDS